MSRQNKRGNQRYRATPDSLGALSGGLLKRALKDRDVTLARLQADWPQVVGAHIAPLTWPEKIFGAAGNKTLVIAAQPIISLELQHQTSQLLERIVTYFGYSAIQSLRFRQELRVPKSLAATLATEQDNRLSSKPLPMTQLPTHQQGALADVKQEGLQKALANLAGYVALREDESVVAAASSVDESEG